MFTRVPKEVFVGNRSSGTLVVQCILKNKSQRALDDSKGYTHTHMVMILLLLLLIIIIIIIITILLHNSNITHHIRQHSSSHLSIYLSIYLSFYLYNILTIH